MRILLIALVFACAVWSIWLRIAYPLPAGQLPCDRIGDPVACAECAFATQKGGR